MKVDENKTYSTKRPCAKFTLFILDHSISTCLWFMSLRFGFISILSMAMFISKLFYLLRICVLYFYP